MNEKYDFNTDTESFLLANDSKVTRLRLCNRIPETSWVETFQRFYKAIINNTVLDHLTVDLREITQLSHGTELLLQAMEENNSIKTIVIMNGFSLHNELRIFAHALVSAISNNKNIEYCYFYGVNLHSQDLATLLRNSASTTTLQFNMSAVDLDNFDENLQELGDAFEQNTTLTSLSFVWNPLVAENNIVILKAARRNKSIVNFSIHFHQGSDEQYDPLVLFCIALYLNASGREMVYFYDMKWNNLTFGTFVSYLNREEDPIDFLLFKNCTFDKDATLSLKEFLLQRRDFLAVSFGGNKLALHDEINVLGEIIGKGEGTKKLDLSSYPGISSPTNGLESICINLASKTSRLHTLILPYLSATQLDYFLDEVPMFKRIRYLWLRLDAESVHLKGKLISAFCRNGCLCNIKIEAPWMTEREFHFLECFSHRNIMLMVYVWLFSIGKKLSISKMPITLYSSAIATSGNGPKDIVAVLAALGDEVCNPETEIYLPSKKLLRMD